MGVVMDIQKQSEVKALLSTIHSKQAKHEREMGDLRNRLIAYAQYFESYAEMYLFIKANTPTIKDFCMDMWEALPIFWNSRKDA
jgi:hypothetical protein